MPNIHEAIYALNSNIVTIRGDVAYDKDEQIIQYDMAQAEVKLAELQAEEAKRKAELPAQIAKQIADLQAQLDELKV